MAPPGQLRPLRVLPPLHGPPGQLTRSTSNPGLTRPLSAGHRSLLGDVPLTRSLSQGQNRQQQPATDPPHQPPPSPVGSTRSGV
ncbi:hypothetical protein HYH03_005569 [Edaphochlamys debaryana]|uniref:Uncharacterized protein n=1 Tax=Edaphochlamys debaryana TaxID=47281 RepID=A0A835YEW8_9CHLO|nr:hypothetical protein HYH03_005569 [Edaphochlamys debaryana]|eukprot:KAG2496339.1 hypothetical protein HYH03_005569 [Edaphochlamys debaryana]